MRSLLFFKISKKPSLTFLWKIESFFSNLSICSLLFLEKVLSLELSNFKSSKKVKLGFKFDVEILFKVSINLISNPPPYP